MAVPTALPEFVKVPLKLSALIPAAPTLKLPSVLGALQLNVVPDGTIVPVGVKLNCTPEQVVSEATFIVAAGSNVTVTVNPAVLQPLGTEGVI